MIYLNAFSITPSNRVKLKENEKIKEHLDIVRGLEKLRNMKVIAIPLSKGLEKRLQESEIRRRIEATYFISQLGSARTLKESWRLRLEWTPPI